MVVSLLRIIIWYAVLATSDSLQNRRASTKNFSYVPYPPFTKCHVHRFDRDVRVGMNRRGFGAVVAAALVAIPKFSGQKVSAAMMEQPKEKFFEIGVTLSADVAKARFQEARITLADLVNNYDSISKEGGDNVRRYLGTVGTTSAMYGIEKVLKGLQNEANDIVAYTENMDDFVYYLRAADTAVYSANFVEFSAAKTKPEKFFDDAKSDCKNILIHMDNMANELNL